MSIDIIIKLSVLLFIVIYLAVRLAINPLLNNSNEITQENNEFELVKLRDIEVLSGAELEEVIKLYKDKGVRRKNYYQYQKYEKILNELKDIGYFSDDQYSSKINKLKKYFKVD